MAFSYSSETRLCREAILITHPIIEIANTALYKRVDAAPLFGKNRVAKTTIIKTDRSAIDTPKREAMYPKAAMLNIDHGATNASLDLSSPVGEFISIGDVRTGVDLGFDSGLYVQSYLDSRAEDFRFANDLVTAANNYVSASPACYNVVCGSFTTAIGATTSLIDASYDGNYMNAARHSATGAFIGLTNGTLGAAYDAVVHFRSVYERK